MPGPDFSLESGLIARGYARIGGVDEAGRGPLAGPVVAAAVILDLERLPEGLDDSKKLSASARAGLEDMIKASSHWAVALASVAEIDRINILAASHLAMERAVAALNPTPDALLVDGNLLPGGLMLPAWAEVKGDERSLSIAAASILAKEERDRIMLSLSRECSGYGWETNMGYPTRAHRAALRCLGPTIHHRRSFRPVMEALVSGYRYRIAPEDSR